MTERYKVNFSNIRDDLELRAELKIIEKSYKNLKLYKYNRIKDEKFVKLKSECRGLIYGNNKIVCIPPLKCMEKENFLDKYKLEECIKEEIIDGTMVNIYWFENGIEFSTRSLIKSEMSNGYGYIYRKMIEEVIGQYEMNIMDLPKDVCLSCVLCHKNNRIIKKNEKNSIYLIEAKKIVGDDYELLDIRNDKRLKFCLFERPELYNNFDNEDEINKFLESKSYDFGGVVCKKGNMKAKFLNNKYENIKKLRKLEIHNNKKLFYALLKEDELKKFLEFFPEFFDKFNEYKNELKDLVSYVKKSYEDRWIKKSVKSISDIIYEIRPIIYNLHKCYLKENIKINRSFIESFIIKLPIYTIFHTLKYKTNS